MTKVIVRDRNGLESALKMFKQKSAKEGSLKKLRERTEGYEKPGVRRRKAKKEGIKNSRKREKANNRY